MAEALYNPDQGYYARPAGQVGRGGDFFTSVSVGPLFGRLLAAHISAWWQEAGSPVRWRIVEAGANDGSLALDILAALEASGAEYVVVEPLPLLAEALRQRSAGALRVVDSTTSLAEDPLPSFVLGNEVLDALPFHVIESDGELWHELGVEVSDGRFYWTDVGPAPADLVAKLPTRPVGYMTEVRDNIGSFLSAMATGMAGGRMLWLDYGFDREDYYHESRTTGTLRTFSRHRAAEDPLESPGEIDITAHVDFTALAEAAEAMGGTVIRDQRQGLFLTEIAKPWLLSLEGRTDVAKDLRAFQTLTHPGQLGAKFRVMEIGFDPP
ncbi:SAM-dependent methyltransferase [Haloferula sp. BvORR071]|uniref:class I SAM-dependent methyltransferase n=1 Tax=Haloferula sp. BvORR071 TaxID=1396141 RepID=UPI0006965188|nr:SAM-dependent methyltransferase [Haloferula sp. BvORR071]